MTSILEIINKAPPQLLEKKVKSGEISLGERLDIQSLFPLDTMPSSTQNAKLGTAVSDRAETKIFFQKLIQSSGSETAIFDILKGLIIGNEEDIAIDCLHYLKNINFQDPNGNSLLHIAVQQGLDQLAYKLLKLKADPTLKNAAQAHALSAEEFAPGGMIYDLLARAMKESNEPFAMSLLDLSVKIGCEIDLNYHFPNGKTLLHLAAENSLCDILYALLARGADPMIKSKDGAYAIDNEDFMPGNVAYELLEIAIAKGQQKIALDLLQLAKKNTGTFQVDAPINKMSLLQLAIKFSQEKVAYELLNMRAKFVTPQGVSVFEKDVKGQTPFAYQLIIQALQAGQQSQAIFLLTHFQKMNANFISGAVDDSGKTLLHISCELGNCEFIAHLLKQGINIDAKDKEGWTALDHLVAGDLNGEIENMLIDHGAASQILSAKFLAHVWGIEGNGQLGTRSFEYSGCTLHPMSRQIAKYGIAFLKSSWLDDLKASVPWLKNEDFSDVVQALSELTTNLKKNPGELVKQSLFGLMTGWEEHATAIASDGKLIMKCDRGKDESLQSGIQIFKMNSPEKLAGAINTLNALSEEESGEAFFESEIDKLLDLQLLSTVNQKQQTVGNCTWASGQSLMLALLILHFSKSYELEKAVQCAQFVYKYWNVFTKIESVKNYFTEVDLIDKSTLNSESPQTNIDTNLITTILNKVAAHQEQKPDLWNFIDQQIALFLSKIFKEAGIDWERDKLE